MAVVTGANKGIGYAIVRGLCNQFNGDVLLTARNEVRGRDAVESLKKEGHTTKFHQLDITDEQSIGRFKCFLQSNYGGIDILVNNAGIAYKADSSASFSEQADVTMKTNFFGTLAVSETLFPLLRPHARVVNVSGMTCSYSIRKCSIDVKAKLTDPEINTDQLENLMKDFVAAAQAGIHKKRGFSDSALGMTKVGITVLSQIQNRQVSGRKEDIIVNACCPGYVDTDMSSHKGPKTIDEGANTPIYLAMLPPNTTAPAGEFVADRKIVNWVEYSYSF